MYVQQNGVDNVYNLGLILFRDLVSFFVDLIPDRFLKIKILCQFVVVSVSNLIVCLKKYHYFIACLFPIKGCTAW